MSKPEEVVYRPRRRGTAIGKVAGMYPFDLLPDEFPEGRGHGCASCAECLRYRCQGCGRKLPWCFGGADDPRCDDCVAGGR